KTYVAENIQEAFYKVKSEMGKDAVILQTKYIKKGGFFGLFAKRMVEVVAANDIKLTSDSPVKPDLTTLAAISSKTNQATSNTGIDDLKTEIKEVKKLLNELYIDTKVQQGNSNALDVNLPLSIKKYYDRMHEMEVDPTI